MSDQTPTSWIFGPETPAAEPERPKPSLRPGEAPGVDQVIGAGFSESSTPPPPPPKHAALPKPAPAAPATAPPAPSGARNNPAAIEIETLVRARYPLLQVISWEEERVMRCLGEIAAALGKDAWQWTINSGLCRYRFGQAGTGEGLKGTKDPLVALKEIAAAPGEAAIYVLKDFHPFMKEAGVVRALRDLAALLRTTYTTLVLLGPTLAMPTELEKELTVVDFPLPGREEIGRLHEQLAEEVADNPALRVDTAEETRQRILEAAVGLTMNEVENVFAKILVRRGRLTVAEVPEVYREKQQIIRKSGLLEYIDAAETIEMVGGMGQLKDWLRKRRRAFHPKARQFGLPVPKGVLFLGVQGCGKSLCAKAVSRFWQMPLLRLDMGVLFGSGVGDSEENVRRAIRIAESVAPVIVWIDEIDKGFTGLGKGADSDAGTASRVFATLLTWLQEKSEPVFVIATANDVEVLPPELLRQGRFDEIFFVDLPTAAERRDIFKIHLALRRRQPSRFDVERLAAASEGYSGAEIEQAVVSALYDAFDRGQDIDEAILLKALEATRPLSVVMAEQIDKRRKWAKGRTRPAA